MLSPEQKKYYLEHKGVRCPYCHSNNITTNNPIDADADYAWQEAECEDCGESWKDIYKLIDMEG